MWKYFFKKPSDQFWAIFKDKLSKNVLISAIYVGKKFFFVFYTTVRVLCVAQPAKKGQSVSSIYIRTRVCSSCSSICKE